MNYTSYISNNFPWLSKSLALALSSTDKELLIESIKRYNEVSIKKAISDFNTIDFTGE